MADVDDGTRGLVDMDRLRQRFDNDNELLGEIFRVFQSETPGRRAGFEQALASGDMNAVTHLAHSLKGVAATMFAEPLRQAAYDLELAGRAGDTAAASRLAAVLLRRLEATNQYVAGLF
ncbi:Hpt protein [Solidesulfovibrio fructosivorans JJ]]|uniref:Hpt protein n=1 Tax=Solidesulfovibrio fructosivorans JJ] TaxID=596151 RepID=E1K1R1_SOLFR|nr:Hpt domain-containing protein [Solidesulfovibrio fructosivorans]EFL49452.1 Hpt protein [Solidesulfovibrio fructosivorans JJ]]